LLPCFPCQVYWRIFVLSHDYNSLSSSTFFVAKAVSADLVKHRLLFP
jgi:hypothetical protein